VLDGSGSDSAMLDEALDLLVREPGSRGETFDLREALAMLVPPAWESDGGLAPSVVDMYRWLEGRMEPWDGPAGLVFTDGLRVGAALDRNGLRPLRTVTCDDGLVGCASEIGVFETDGRGRVRRGRVAPGGMLIVDPNDGAVQVDPVASVAARKPFGRWLAASRTVGTTGVPAAPSLPEPERLRAAHGYTREDLSLLLKPAAASGKEPTYSMGDDAPIPPLSTQRRSLFDFLRQRFAQVTNPAIDPVRERLVMSTRVLLGGREGLLDPPAGRRLTELDTFVLFEAPSGMTLDATWPVAQGTEGLREALERLGRRCVDAVRAGAAIVVVSNANVDRELAPIPSALAIGAADAALLRAGERTCTSIVAIADDAFSSHHVACLLALGAESIVPRLAFATAAAGAGDDEGEVGEALLRLRTAIEDGVLKVLSKLGISCVDSYRGARMLDVLGLAGDVTDVVDLPASPLGGFSLDDIASHVLERHRDAFDAASPTLTNPGLVKFHKGGEYHANHPDAVRAVHETVDPGLETLKSTAAADGVKAAARASNGDEHRLRAAHALRRATTRSDEASYRRFAELVDGRPTTAPRDLLDIIPATTPVPLDEVEPAAAILRRFSSGAISHGAISKEAHETLAVAMRMVGGRANTGEGGEDPARYRTDRNSSIKQVASGRFGVTPEYLAFAEELQIKIAQGSKPGEGGQLPGHKVTDEIARLRHTRTGVALISPAPHHDIYSIEDLAQLVYDLKQVNSNADVSVKLVAEEGVGTVAAGVAKALAEIVHIAGADGGTGASPLSSIRHAGLPWELGLAETQRALSAEGLRGRVRLRVDGGIKTGRDVVIAALLGADEFSFGTAVLLAEGCLMVRSCHLDTCPVGIATQRPELRAKFAGTPEMVATYLRHVAEDVRSTLATLGVRTLEEAIGRVELLRARSTDAPIDVTPLLEPAGAERRFTGRVPLQRSSSPIGDTLADEMWPALREGGSREIDATITNRDRTVGARLGGLIGREYAEAAPDGRATVRFSGDAGQSFGAFLASGVDLRLTGAANDGVGKGMNGGRVVIVPPSDDAGDPCLVGNTALYGATGGELFVAGSAGERFAVRNSGATGVVEGAGAHCCEYMTGGVVVVLGPVGPNLGAGMTGGEAFVFDPETRLPALVNTQLVEFERADDAAADRVRVLVERHVRLTASYRAVELLADWETARRLFWHVIPRRDVADVAMRQEGTVRRAATAASR
jgi:glutamate synthase (ferredoxin)